MMVTVTVIIISNKNNNNDHDSNNNLYIYIYIYIYIHDQSADSSCLILRAESLSGQHESNEDLEGPKCSNYC